MFADNIKKVAVTFPNQIAQFIELDQVSNVEEVTAKLL